MADPPKPDDPGKAPAAPAPPLGKGDFRGAYGFGRPAHKSDPSGTYFFDLDRPLPNPLAKPDDE